MVFQLLQYRYRAAKASLRGKTLEVGSRIGQQLTADGDGSATQTMRQALQVAGIFGNGGLRDIAHYLW